MLRCYVMIAQARDETALDLGFDFRVIGRGYTASAANVDAQSRLDQLARMGAAHAPIGRAHVDQNQRKRKRRPVPDRSSDRS